MTFPASRARRRPSALGMTLPLLLVVSLLVPVTVLFLQTRQTTDDDRDFAVRERHAVAYLRSLGRVTIALADAQSAAVSGRSFPGAALTSAVEETTRLDTDLGDELRTRERWAGLRAKIEALPERRPADGRAAYTAYSETTDLLLALYGKIRESSGLIRDPAADSYFLQDSVAEELPEALIAAGRLTDLAVLAAVPGGADRDRVIADFSAARAAVLSPAGDIVDNLLAAVDRTESGSLGGILLRQIDGYQRAVEAIAAASTLTSTPPADNGSADDKPDTAGADADGTTGAGPVLAVDVTKISAARSSGQSAATELSTIIFTELDALIAARIDDLDGQRRLSVGATGLGLLLALALATVMILRERRRPRPDDPQPAAPEPEPASAMHWEPPAVWPNPLPTELSTAPAPPALAVRDNQAAHSGRSDAAR